MNRDNFEAEVNVTAYIDLLRGTQETVLYDGDVVFRGATFLLNEAGRTVKPGFFKRLEYIAEEVKKILVRETEDLEDFQREDVLIKYDSDTNKDYCGSHGYTAPEGSFLQRALNQPEMEELIKKVDARIRPLFYKERKNNK